MPEPICFFLNQELVSSCEKGGMVLADYVRDGCGLKGTTVACREGDCGACTLLIGRLTGKRIRYRAITSCISPLINTSTSHVVSIEGLSAGSINPLQRALMEHGGTQCGFCTPGFLVSLAGYFIEAETLTVEGAIGAIDGNICRCTGYKSIERAVVALVERYARELGGQSSRLEQLVALGILPQYFLAMPARLAELVSQREAQSPAAAPSKLPQIVGGGTDLFVQGAEALHDARLTPTVELENPRVPRVVAGILHLPGACSIEDFRTSPFVAAAMPRIPQLLKLFASTQIRHQGTLAGNIANASPIGDLSNLFLALDACLTLQGPEGERTVALQNFYRAYKSMDLKPGETIASIEIPLPGADSYVNFEKVSRREHLDIASVTTSMHLRLAHDTIEHAAFSLGGVAPIPLYLRKMPAALRGKKLRPLLVQAAVALVQEEISPIADVRGTVAYKRLLVRQLLYAHFISCFPQLVTAEALLA